MIYKKILGFYPVLFRTRMTVENLDTLFRVPRFFFFIVPTSRSRLVMNTRTKQVITDDTIRIIGDCYFMGELL